MTDLARWLLAPENPSARYLALVEVLGRPADDPEVAAARAAIPGHGPARAILDAQWPDGYWMRPGVGYSPRHKATVWQVIFLGALGAPRTEAIDRACAHVMDHSRLADGRFSAHRHARGAVACLNGNLLRAFAQLGYEDARLAQSREALAEMVLGDRFCCRFGAPAPKPARMGDGPPCAWGAVKALGAFAEIPEGERSAAVGEAVAAGVEFLLDGHLPGGTASGPVWHKFGFPPARAADLLEALDVLGKIGMHGGPQIEAAREIVQGKRDESGRWALERTPDNTWADFGRLGAPNKWVTLRALRVLA